ncbi:N-acetyltransferase [Sphingopyxis sp. XHP0097]|uniref:N-acetyltransferase n=1 Tax=Sphingopyxis jiangsuensis TaxID=2871171 RepID=A0ABS7M9Z7_9SPHN|nr:N-acetyltransferase [Sphingopyxis jiangsuensis]MBY4635773.1 N-acetyltransferase [Sphingopyxis jiangsuensis]
MAAHSEGPITIRRVENKADKREFVELAYRLNRGDPAWVPPLKNEVFDLLTPGKNPWFEHGKAQLFLARRGERTVGRISAHIDALALAQPAEQGMGPGTGNWGLLEAEDEEVAAALFAAAEDWLRAQGMHRALGPLSISVWDEPGLLIEGFAEAPTIMLGHNSPLYRGWVEAAGYRPAKQLLNYAVDIVDGFPPIVERIVAAGEKNARIRVRRVDKRRFDAEAALIMGILNDAWSDNWGFVPLTDSEIAHVGKKLKALVFEDLIRIAEVDGEPVAFMIVLPDINELLIDMNGSLLPFHWAKLLWWLHKPKSRRLRVPLMGVVKKLQNSRMASTLAFMMIEFIRRDAVRDYGATRGDIGWVLDDNQGMKAVADAIEARVNRVYQIYDKSLG